MKKQLSWLMAAMMAVLIVGCANQKGPAEQAIAGAESALGAIRDTAQKYVPDQLAQVDTQLASLKDAFGKCDYKTVVAGAPALTASINSLKEAAAAKASEAEAAMAKAKEEWASVSTDLPKMVAALQSRVDMLSKSHHLPAGVTKDTLASAKSGLDTIKSGWNEATAAATSGDFTTAMGKATRIKDQATELMKSLGMTTG